MTPTIKTLTAVAALTLAAGGAMAQDTQTVPLDQPDAAAIVAPDTGTTFVLNPDGSSETLAAEVTEAVDEAVADLTAQAQDAVEAVEDAVEAAVADEPEAAEAAEPAADEATEDAAEAEEAADAEATEAETAADEAAEEAPADEPEAAAEDATEDAADEVTDEAEEATEADAAEDEAVEEEATDEATEEDTAEEVVDEADEAEDATEEDEEEAVEEEEVEEAAAPIEQHITDVAFSFEGPFGKYDQHQLQRGLQVYTEICAACHGLQYVPLRTLGDATGPGLPEDQVRAYAAEFYKIDPETEEEVPREPSDHFPIVPVVEGMGPDLSLMAKARAGFHGPYGTGINQLFNGIGGPEYIYSILTGYTGETKEEAGTVLYENTAFPGGWISMTPPLYDESVEFEDGHPNDLASISKEVSAFLMWTAEPKMMQRKQMGFVSVIFLLVLTILLYLTNKKLWAPHKHPRKED